MARHLLLVRHGPIAPELQGRFVGATDVPLAPSCLLPGGDGEAGDRPPHLGQLAQRLAGFRPQRCYCSPKLRCRQTAQALATLLAERGLPEGLPIRLDEDLGEIDFGRWEQRSFAEIAQDDPELAQRWAEFPQDFTFPGGEALAKFLERVRRAAQRLLDDPVDTVVAVTHGGVIRMMLCHLLGLEPRQYLTFEVGYGSLTVMERIADSRFQVADWRQSAI